ncbi:uncharacterized protein LOC116299824 isoform X2 [Actinia tenebrosa]|uniref:Uncharacterized protein LOC116299824 isoform X2 n=1 Tax=Actinia tenebrosa TaxID=6105 RepID=A0A6P8IEM1_ACTTE|nr:uncharacterized protein LOC116299824 isoform X2 [Actinia tenebrosa]
MAVNRTTQRPNTCCTSTGATSNNVEKHANQRQAWMAFHKKRPDSNMVTTPMSWPGCGRPAAGLTTLEADYRRSRLVSTAQPAPRPKIKPRRLPPIKDNATKSKDKAKGRRHKNERSDEMNDETPSKSATWARQWANHRAKQTGVVTSNEQHHDMEISDDDVEEKDSYQEYIDHKRACAVPYQKRRQKVVSLSEREAATMRRLRGIYCNTKEKSLRVEKLKESIKALQDRTLHTEVDASMREYDKKTKVDKGNRKELKRVRDRYFKDKQRRTKHSHISLNALETPQVSRHAYGLPEEGKEFEETTLARKTEKRLQDIWKKAVRRAIVIDKMINSNKKALEPSLPLIRVKRTSVSREATQHEAPVESNPKSQNNLIDLQATMNELDGLSSVGSDSEDNDLTDIGEED